MLRVYQCFVPWTGFEVSKDPRGGWHCLYGWLIHVCAGGQASEWIWAQVSDHPASPEMNWCDEKIVPGWEPEKVPFSSLTLGVASRRQSDGIRLKRFAKGWPTNLFPEKAETSLARLWNLSRENIGHFHKWRWMQLSQQNNKTDPRKSSPGAR